MVDGAVDEGGGHVLVAEHASPSAEFDVGGVDDAPRLVALGYGLEQQAAAFRELGGELYLAKEEV